ncbi:bifunctional DNA primase/polymerase [Ruegeria atlantica]|uniref:bifunctional DNA primase/polymerase n=1 Tax=Ruegeria atlantica TaxID=81569 RepID=UPI001481B072|nr:bifunctional DNA primase/polymerase [Ruegeria atlantica]
MTALVQSPKPQVPAEEIARLHGAGFNLLPLGGGSDAKAPLCSLQDTHRYPLKRVLGPMYGKGSACYGVRLSGLVVIDCDDDGTGLVNEMEARFGASPVQVSTPRGVHLYYKDDGGQAPNLRAQGFPVDVKRGASSYVVGPHSIRPDGGVYHPVQGILGADDLPAISLQTDTVQASTGAISKGSRNRELSLTAIGMVEAVETPEELFCNLAFIRDDECEDPDTLPDSELRKIADWAWAKRLEGKVYRDRNSEFRINRAALDKLSEYNNASDAIALLVTLQANHGHIIGKTFALDHAGMAKAGHTSLGRRRFSDAIKSLRHAGLLGVAKEYSVGRSHRTYRLLRITPEMPNVHSLHSAQEVS